MPERLGDFARHERAVRKMLNDDLAVAALADAFNEGATNLSKMISAARERCPMGSTETATDVAWCVRSVLSGDIPTLIEALEVRMRYIYQRLLDKQTEATKTEVVRTPSQVAELLSAQDPQGVLFGVEVELRRLLFTTLQLAWNLDVTPPPDRSFPQEAMIHLWRGSYEGGRIEKGIRMSIALSHGGTLTRAERTDMDALAEKASPTASVNRVRAWIGTTADIPELDAKNIKGLKDAPIPTKWVKVPMHPGLKVRPGLEVPKAPKRRGR